MDLMPINGVMVLSVGSRVTVSGMIFSIFFGVCAVLVLLFVAWGLFEEFFTGRELAFMIITLCVCIFFCAYGTTEREPIYQITISDDAKATEVLEHYEILKIDGSIITVREIKDEAD